ncbi:palmitoyltransferase ZDHHC22-like [Pecten maximus]|uniref:palmitoyltransferase ZDHHC22-like n=1 Tax=Pecten maximus TaxID=6579 RepID=UPI001458CDB8|nr:palmitoyltransferase ZDHHC22-like [Pecten maximus]
MELRERNKGGTLKEKLQNHYHKRNFQTDEKDASRYGQMFFWGMVVSLFFEGQFFLVPMLYWGDTWAMILASVLVWFTLFECTINWMGTYFGQNNYVTSEIKEEKFPGQEETPPGWINCPKCQVDAPPRSHHCRLCNRCVLKRDHHCFFTNSCVGFYNQRFFVMFCIYMVWGNLFALFLQLTYTTQSIPVFSWDGLAYIPMVGLVYFFMGYVSLGQLFLIVHICFCFMCFCGGVFFLCWQIILAAAGMTSYEAWKGIPWYRRTSLENVRSVFGSIWKIPFQLLFPFRVDQDGNGVEWTVRSKTVKYQ